MISFIIETNADTGGREAQIRDAFAASGLLPYAHAQTPGAPWPTLAAMIAANQRLVVLTDDRVAEYRLQRHRLSRVPGISTCGRASPSRRTSRTRKPANFSCADNRGTPGNDLFIFNHFLTNNIGAPVFARQVNYDPLLSSRARECWAAQDHIPNFVTVDFYEIGSVLRTTNLLNYLWGQIERRAAALRRDHGAPRLEQRSQVFEEPVLHRDRRRARHFARAARLCTTLPGRQRCRPPSRRR